ncbi:LysM domain-containing protein [Lutibacter oricola]|uniref:LysM domain-containing protein n=1 Tax=Lutibacter oricola TaxID=762486 RepID=A0A1H2XFZ1_9FLAO|nr:M23 family metallopeptidase [Lutibacter oricola]SDW91823.1 LysM domain-containing protein [Lutibacter oricola]
MKPVYLFFFLFCLGFNNYGQNKKDIKINVDSIIQIILAEDIQKIKKDTLGQLAIQDSIITSPKDSIINTWLTENWNTSVLNSYKQETIIQPFNIKFLDSTYHSPIERKKVITSHYGWRNRHPHYGIDIDLITGDNVFAMFDGKVRYVGYNRGHGKVIVIRHFNGLETVYAHLSKRLVKANDIVLKGEIIGKGGNSGNSTGSHLHLEVNYKGNHINPEYLFDFEENNIVRAQNIWVTKKWTTAYNHNTKRQSNIKICNTLDEAIQSEVKQKELYIVKRGDTLSRISSKHHVSITSICKSNAIRKTSTLRIGQKLILVK